LQVLGFLLVALLGVQAQRLTENMVIVYAGRYALAGSVWGA